MDINGLDINYKISGPDDAAHTMVILQGWGTEMGLYDSVAAAVNDTYRVVQFDLPGFGASDEPKEPWNVDAYADFFCGFMEKLGIKKAVLFGHSYGGRVIIKLAARENLPFEIERIVLADSAGVMPEKTASQQFRVRIYKLKRNFLKSKLVYPLFPEVIDYWMSKQGSEDYKAASPMMKKCLVMAVNEDRHAIGKLIVCKLDLRHLPLMCKTSVCAIDY